MQALGDVRNLVGTSGQCVPVDVKRHVARQLSLLPFYANSNVGNLGMGSTRGKKEALLLLRRNYNSRVVMQEMAETSGWKRWLACKNDPT